MEQTELQNSKISIAQLIKLAWTDRLMLTLYCLVAAIIGTLYAFSIPRTYQSQVMLAPEESENGLNSNVSSLASMVGIDMGISSTDAIYPEIYPDMMHSTKFLVSMFDIRVKSKNGKINTTLSDYLEHYQKSSWFFAPLHWFKKHKDNKFEKDKKVNPYWLTKTESEIATNINDAITCLVDKKTNVITITAKAQDPLIASTITEAARQRLQQFITDYRTTKAKQDLQYVKQLCSEAKAQYVKARRKYGAYSDANQDLLLQSAKSTQEDLENDMQLKYNIYTQVMQQLQMAQAKLQEKTPAFTIIQNATVPYKHSNTPKIYILAVFILIGIGVRSVVYTIINRKRIAALLSL